MGATAQPTGWAVAVKRESTRAKYGVRSKEKNVVTFFHVTRLRIKKPKVVSTWQRTIPSLIVSSCYLSCDEYEGTRST